MRPHPIECTTRTTHTTDVPATGHDPRALRGRWLLLPLLALLTALVAATAGAATAGATTPAPAKAAKPHARWAWSPVQRKYVRAFARRRLGGVLSTWYGPGLYGNHVACGGTLRTGTWGVAHRSLPCGTMLLLSYGGRSVAVPVIDRGPFSGASLDLTSQVARHLGFQGAGHVKVDVLGPKVNAAASTRVTGGKPPRRPVIA
jgi:rare lipoprotein A (peptidoglycan hydrolase)